MIEDLSYVQLMLDCEHKIMTLVAQGASSEAIKNQINAHRSATEAWTFDRCALEMTKRAKAAKVWSEILHASLDSDPSVL